MKEFKAILESNREVADGIFEAKLLFQEKVDGLCAGKFLNVSVGDKSHVLKRPFGISDYDTQGEWVKFCYQVKGDGTKSLSNLKAGVQLMVTIPLGNGFPTTFGYKKIAIVAGGMGVCPFGALGKSFSGADITAYLGFRNDRVECLTERIASFADTKVIYDDKPQGDIRNAVQLMLADLETNTPEVIFACGPKPMLRALKCALQDNNINIPSLVSLEERMGCGVGACLVCVCKQAKADGNVRICKDGPVFDIWEVEL